MTWSVRRQARGGESAGPLTKGGFPISILGGSPRTRRHDVGVTASLAAARGIFRRSVEIWYRSESARSIRSRKLLGRDFFRIAGGDGFRSPQLADLETFGALGHGGGRYDAFGRRAAIAADIIIDITARRGQARIKATARDRPPDSDLGIEPPRAGRLSLIAPSNHSIEERNECADSRP
jgi:hypothetical protein